MGLKHALSLRELKSLSTIDIQQACRMQQMLDG